MELNPGAPHQADMLTTGLPRTWIIYQQVFIIVKKDETDSDLSIV